METRQQKLTHLLSFEIWAAAASVGAAIIFPKLLPVSIVVMAVFWIVRILASQTLSRRTPIDWGIIVLAISAPVGIWVSPVKQETLVQVFRLFSGLFLFYSVVNWAKSIERIKMLIWGAIAAGAGLAIMATFSVDWIFGKLPFLPEEIYSKFQLLIEDVIHKNVMGGNLLLLFPLPLSLLLYARKEWKNDQRWLMVGAVVLMAGMIVLTQSRGAIIGMLAVLAVFIVLYWQRGWLVMPALGIGIGAIFVIFDTQLILEWLSRGVSLEGFDGRLEVWTRGLALLWDFPFTGVGMGGFGRASDLLYPFLLFEPGVIPHSHNLYLQIAVDLGIPGFIAWLSIFMGISITAIRTIQLGTTDQNDMAKALGGAFLGMQIAMGVHGMLDSVVWGMIRPAPMVWGLWGIIIAVFLYYREESQNKKREETLAR